MRRDQISLFKKRVARAVELGQSRRTFSNAEPEPETVTVARKVIDAWQEKKRKADDARWKAQRKHNEKIRALGDAALWQLSFGKDDAAALSALAALEKFSDLKKAEGM